LSLLARVIETIVSIDQDPCNLLVSIDLETHPFQN
jgi:hypothetical protein